MKRFFALLLAALMALSLCGCGEKEDTAPDQGGNVIEPPVADPGQTPASPDGGPEAALYRKYKAIIDALEDKNYNRAIHEIVVLSNADKPQAEKTPIAAYFTGDWYLNVDSDYPDSPKVLNLSDTGIVKLDGAAYNWLEQGSSDTNLSGWLLKDGVHTYYLSLGKNADSLVPQVSLYTVKQSGNDFNSDKSLGVYYNDAMLGWAFDSWQNLDDQDKVMPRSFTLNRNRLSMNSTEYTWTVTKTGANAISFAIGDNYTLDVELRGVQPIAALTDKTTGNSANYHTGEHGYDRSWPEYIYPEAVQYLNQAVERLEKNYSPNFYSYLAEEGQSLNGNAAMKYLYDTFAGLGNYKDSAQILSRFTVLEGMHTNTAIQYVDNMGNTGTNREYQLFSYDAQGRMILGRSDQLHRLYGSTQGYDKYFTYDDQGRLISVHEGSGSISAKMTLTLDDQGRMVGGTYKTNYYEHPLSYSYDDQGRMTESISWDGNQRLQSVYTYDDQGRLIRIVTWKGDESYNYRNYRYTTTYTYDDRGRLANETEVYEFYNSYVEQFYLRNTRTFVYTAWDDQGRPLTADYSYTDSEGKSNYASQTARFLYDDLYLYENYTFYFYP